MGKCSVASPRQAAKKYVIGKIPGYNSGILPNTGGKVNSNASEIYTNRLLNNLNTIEFTPIAYRLNFSGILPDVISDALEGKIAQAGTDFMDGVKKLEQIFTDMEKKLESDAQSDSYSKMGSAVFDGVAAASKALVGGTVKVSRRRSSQAWMNLLYLGVLHPNNTVGRANLHETLYDGFTILGTNDSTFNETISNEYGPNRFQQAAEDISSKIKESAIGSAASLVGNLYRSYDSANGLEALGIVGQFGLLGALSGIFQGVKIQLPQVWNNSDYNSSLNIMIRLISPSGDQASIKKYIKDPLEILIRATAPITLDGMMYGYPMIWDVKAHGVMHLKLATVTALTITRGGNDTVFNKYDEPLNVDVRLMITPINPGFAQGPMCDYSMTDPTDIIVSLSSAYQARPEETINGNYQETPEKLKYRKIFI